MNATLTLSANHGHIQWNTNNIPAWNDGCDIISQFSDTVHRNGGRSTSGLGIATGLRCSWDASMVPELRKKKLGSVVSMALAEKMTNAGQMVFACVYDNNETGKAFHETNGYIRLPYDIRFCYYFF